MPKLKPGTILPTPEEDAAITQAAHADPDAIPYTDEEWAKARPVRGRGRPAGSGKKEQVTMRIDAEILAAFKAQGNGWQTRMNEALREFLVLQSVLKMPPDQQSEEAVRALSEALQAWIKDHPDESYALAA